MRTFYIKGQYIPLFCKYMIVIGLYSFNDTLLLYEMKCL